MNYKTLKLGDNRRENIVYHNKAIPLSVCLDNFDDYFQREWTCHWHDEFEFATVLTGCVQYTIYDGADTLPTQQLHEGDGIFINTGSFHSAKALTPETSMTSIVFPLTFFDMKPFENFYTQNIHPIIDSGITHCVLNRDNENHSALLATINKFGTIDETEIGYELHCVELVCRIWRMLTAIILNKKDKSEANIRNILQGQRVRKIMSYIHSHYSEHISVEDMAKSAAISKTECFRCFREILKKSPVEYLLEYRLSMAAILLVNTDLSMIDISYSCGFNSPSYFGKQFKTACGLSPKRYREQSRKKH